MKKVKKFSSIIEIPGPLELMSNEIGRVRLALFETRRQMERVSGTCLLVAKDGRPFPEAYRCILIREKEGLLAMLKRRVKGLNGIRPSKYVLKQINQDIRTVEQALGRLNRVTPERIANKMAHDFDLRAENDAFNLSTRFVSDGVVYNLLNGGPMGRAKLKKLIAE